MAVQITSKKFFTVLRDINGVNPSGGVVLIKHILTRR